MIFQEAVYHNRMKKEITLAKIKQLFAENLSVKDIAEKLNCKPGLIYYRLKQANGKSRLSSARDDGNLRLCRKCKRWKIRDTNFAPSSIHTTKRDTQCLDCSSLYRRSYHLSSKYDGMTIEQYEELLKQQGNCCAICHKPAKRLHVDHNHTTGKVRGLLCRPCNTGIGLLDESPSTLLSAVKYLS